MMQRFTSLAVCGELAFLTCPWKRSIVSLKHDTHSQPWWHQRVRPHASCATSPKRAWHHLRRPSAPSARQHCRHYSKDADRDTKDTEHPGITVVGTPDPITWIRNKIILFLIELYFGLKFSVEFDSGVKQVGMIRAQKWLIKGKLLKIILYATTTTKKGKKRDDPESSRIFKMDITEDGPQKKIITAVYEFYRELTAGADPEWTVTRIWHWKQLE
ncbi:uncharacterized protein LOC107716985 [Sinocyclocheilus rhinocerous]|uniref:uncharacterized protein LOC107716985 n=1 Tax=Sinocyclocheilus rhinocerous TaxID=307959 RepID=UPI0007B8BE80|nr:PREDICTED: uncharacterized protein LOC107716985 [Sinocyclocheilus rhinocerous]